MRHFIVKSTDKQCLRIDLVGSKALNLARLLAWYYPVPPFLVISTDVFKCYIKHLRRSQGKSASHLLTESYDVAKAFFSSVEFGGKEMPARFWQAFASSVRSLEPQESKAEPKLVVRSSSPFEDRVAHSFAGQFTTILGVRGIDATWEAIKECWLSLWKANVQSYLAHFDLGRADGAMAVIVQRMVEARASGILFTAEPVSGDVSTMLVEASPRSPDGVVSGKIEPWRFRLDKETLQKVWVQPTGEKDCQNRLGFSDSSNLSEPILSEDNFRELGKVGKSIEARFNRPQDIEWAYDQKKLWLLQTRPMMVTRPNDRQRRDDKGELWTDYFFVERFVEPVSPLGWSIIGKWIEKRALREPLFYLGFDELSRRAGLTHLFDFHPFTRTEVFQALYSVVPDFAISEDKKQVFISESKRHIWWIEFIRRLPFLASRLLFRDPNWIPPLHLRNWKGFLVRYQNKLQVNRKSLNSYNYAELCERFYSIESLTDELLSYHRWSITFADLFFHLLQQLVQRWVPEADASICVDLVSGLTGNKTIEANLELALLAQKLADIKKKAGERGKETNSCKLADSPEFKMHLEQFLDRHGHRSQNLDPYYPTWRENPDFVLGIINDMSLDVTEATKVAESEEGAVKTRHQAESFVFTSIGKRREISSKIKNKTFRLVLDMAQSFALLRENQRYYWHLALAEKRRIMLEVGNRLVGRNLLSSLERIFFLTRSEFLRCFDPHADLTQLRKMAEIRYKKWQRTISAGPPAEESQTWNTSEVRVLHGLGVSAGEIQAKASIVRSLDEAQKITPGSILVTGSVDPAWTPIFAKAAGLVLEVGGVLSHAAIVAREFRLPAVTSVTRAASIIADGQVIRVNGLKGTVQLVPDQ